MKKKVTYTLEKELLEELKEFCDKRMIPHSRFVEKSISILLKYHKDKLRREEEAALKREEERLLGVQEGRISPLHEWECD